MTIAGLYLSPEGVVLGADSTATAQVRSGQFHFFDFNQKVFEIGEGGTLGMLTWGLGSIGGVSYRTLLALLADELVKNPPKSVSEVASRWVDKIYDPYMKSQNLVRLGVLETKDAFGQPPAPGREVRTQEEDQEYVSLLMGLDVGFCFAGYVLPDRFPEAATVVIGPKTGKPTPQMAGQDSISWFGVPNFFSRLLFGIDPALKQDILSSGKWNGTPDELNQIVAKHARPPSGSLPIRDAIDYVYSCIQCTIKAVKFSELPQVCGGPIELAVITTDRKFRWVRHKSWDAAITDGEPHEA